jgi:integrase/recombinase XerD
VRPLRDAVAEYIALRRALGFKLRDMAIGLTEFAAFLEQHAAPYITTPLAVAWAMQPAHHQPSDWAKRLGFVRVFARHWSATDPRTEIPAAGLLPFRARRARPYLYSDEEIRQLLAATHALSSTIGLRPWTYHCLFGLLVVSGIRISEAISLDRHDVNLHDGLLTIRKTKFNKTRLIPLHASTQEVFIAYAGRRDRLVPHPTSQAFLLTDRGRRLEISAVHRTFYDLSHRTGLRAPTDHTGPRIHDFRHRFAVNTLIQWYRAEADIERRLPVLSTFLGHAHVADTYWYLSIHPELMGLATTRLERRWGLTHED